MSYYEPPFERGQGALTRTLAVLLRFWYLTVPLTVLGAATGAYLSTLTATTYTAEVRLGVGGQTLDAQTVPGFVFASQELAATYARYVDDASAAGRLQQQVGVEAAENITEVSASPIPESSIIVIEVQGVVADAVQQAAQRLAEGLVDQVSGSTIGEEAQEALAEFEELSAQVAQQQVLIQSLQSDLGAVEASPASTPAIVEDMRTQIATAQAQLSVLSLRQSAAGDRYRELSSENVATLSVIRDAEVVEDDGMTRMLVWGVLGLVAGGALSLLLASRLSRRRTLTDRPALEAWAKSHDRTTYGPNATPDAPTGPAGSTSAARADLADEHGDFHDEQPEERTRGTKLAAGAARAQRNPE